MNHRVGRSLFALAVGLVVFGLAYRWITDPVPRAQREAEERAVLAARDALGSRIGGRDLEIVDPLLPNRKLGKVYVYAEGPGWAVSGFYRRDDADPWHPYLIYLDQDLSLHSLKVEDTAIEAK
jgi:hypothetical protein